MDALNDIFDTLKLKGILYFRTDFSPPWGVTVPEHGSAARFHLVIQGKCHVEFDSGASAELGPGDLILIPKGRPHILTDRYGREAPPLETVLESAGYDGQGVFVVGEGDPEASTQMVCGHFSFRNLADHPIINALPDYILTTNAIRAREPWLDELLRLIAHRIFAEQVGAEATVRRLSEIVFIELLRIGIGQSETLKSVLGAFMDEKIGRALQLIHQQPDRHWTVDKLAAEAGMSRSRFAERFSDMIGKGPLAYLSDWRLQKSLSLLEDSRSSIQQVASQTGYRSPAAFTRAFAGKFGLPPTEYRRNIA